MREYGLETKKKANSAENELWWGNDAMAFEEQDTDLVNHPPHYNKGIETTTYIKSWNMSWNQANIIKYVSRYNLKHSDSELQLQDLKKAQWYLNDLVKDLKEKTE